MVLAYFLAPHLISAFLVWRYGNLSRKGYQAHRKARNAMTLSKNAYLHAIEIMLGVALRILGVAPTVGEKGVSLKVGETGASPSHPSARPCPRSYV